jgi:hypothetical protein
MARLAVSGVLVGPCWWHRHIEAGDLGSHTYNAWLAQLVRAGHAPGLWLTGQYSNVLFDWMLDAATRWLGFGTGERLCVSVAVMVFFWGGFTLVSAFGGHNAWRTMPLLAMVSYGWTFHMGFFNYYIGLGLAFFAIAAICRNSRSGVLVSLALFPIVWLAHPLSAAVLACLSAYIVAAKLLPLRFHAFLLLGCSGVIAGARQYLAEHYDVRWENSDPFFLNGTDQFVLFGQKYALLAYGVLALLLSAWVTDLVTHRHRMERRAVPAQLYFLVLLIALWLPDYIPVKDYAAPLTMITLRLTAVCAVLACAWFAAIRPHAWQIAGLVAAAIVYFGMVYQDTGTLSRTEDAVESLVSGAANQRVILVVPPASYRASRIGHGHLVDRACVGRCFSFSNYEPASRAFRVRAADGNGIVIAKATDSAAMQMGTYIVRGNDLPVLSIYQCGPALTDICSRRLAEGDRNGRGAY